MAGIYIHIPFCKKACHYCDFHFSTSLKQKEELILALIKEIKLQADFITEPVTSIYFGGGTPSLLSEKELHQLFDALKTNFTIPQNIEITLEANPDDLSKEKLRSLASSPVNRLSIGVQSFFNEDLQYMNRVHTSEEAKTSINIAQDIGFNNISIDFIYGTPTLTNRNWQKNLEIALELVIPHVSAYSLTVEPNTALHKMIEQKKVVAPSEEKASQHFELLMQKMQANDYDHYEISNFCQAGKQAMHNTNYWKGISYLGIGPSAHSFIGNDRFWNISNNVKYIHSINKGVVPSVSETLSSQEHFNEKIMTGLRTKWGISIDEIEKEFGTEKAELLLKEAKRFIEKNLLSKSGNKITLTHEGKFFADKISSELFWV